MENETRADDSISAAKCFSMSKLITQSYCLSYNGETTVGLFKLND